MKEVQRRCLECWWSYKDPQAPVEAVLTGNAPSVCLRRAPSAAVMATARGIANVTIYPTVTRDTLSCGDFTDASKVTPQAEALANGGA